MNLDVKDAVGELLGKLQPKVAHPEIPDIEDLCGAVQPHLYDRYANHFVTGLLNHPKGETRKQSRARIVHSLGAEQRTSSIVRSQAIGRIQHRGGYKPIWRHDIPKRVDSARVIARRGSDEFDELSVVFDSGQAPLQLGCPGQAD